MADITNFPIPTVTVGGTASEIVAAYATLVAQVAAGEITAATETALRTYSPADIKSFIDQHAGGGGDLSQADIDTLAELNAILTDATLIDTSDARLDNARTPTSHALGGSEHAASTLAELNAKVSDATLIDTGDSRLSDARTPTSHAASHTNGSDDIQDATSGQKGLMTAAQATKVGHLSVTQAVDLDAIESRVNELDASVILKGTWDASSGSFPGSGTAQAGESWIVSIAGTVDSVPFAVDDRIIAITDNASTSTFAANWHKADYSDLVQSVAGLTGTISAAGLRTAINVEDNAAADQTAGEIEAIVSHDNLLDFVANKHIDWTSASANFSTSGTAATGALTVSGANLSLAQGITYTAAVITLNGSTSVDATIRDIAYCEPTADFTLNITGTPASGKAHECTFVINNNSGSQKTLTRGTGIAGLPASIAIADGDVVLFKAVRSASMSEWTVPYDEGVATSAEINTGTDNNKRITASGLAGSTLQTDHDEMAKPIPDSSVLSSGKTLAATDSIHDPTDPGQWLVFGGTTNTLTVNTGLGTYSATAPLMFVGTNGGSGDLSISGTATINKPSDFAATVPSGGTFVLKQTATNVYYLSGMLNAA